MNRNKIILSLVIRSRTQRIQQTQMQTFKRHLIANDALQMFYSRHFIH